jgi:hypothetical protein
MPSRDVMGCCPRPKVAVTLSDSLGNYVTVTEYGGYRGLARIIVSWRGGSVCAIGGVVKQTGMTLGVRFG